MTNASIRTAVSCINAAYAAFEEVRSGRPCYIASDIKSLERPDRSAIVKGAAGYAIRYGGSYNGALFRVIELDSDGAKNLVRAVTSNVGMLAASNRHNNGASARGGPARQDR
eukprot:2831341-Amphidinium_carterae.1